MPAVPVLQQQPDSEEEPLRKSAMAEQPLQTKDDSSQQPVVQRVNINNVDSDTVHILGSDGEYAAYYGRIDDQEEEDERERDNRIERELPRAGTLTLTNYGDSLWITGVYVDSGFQRLGIGLSLLRKAVEVEGPVFAALGMRQPANDEDDDPRFLTREGTALVRSAIRNNVLYEDWCFDPTADHQEDEDDEDFTEEEIQRYTDYSPSAIIQEYLRTQDMRIIDQWLRQFAPDERDGIRADTLRTIDRME